MNTGTSDSRTSVRIHWKRIWKEEGWKGRKRETRKKIVREENEFVSSLKQRIEDKNCRRKKEWKWEKITSHSASFLPFLLHLFFVPPHFLPIFFFVRSSVLEVLSFCFVLISSFLSPISFLLQKSEPVLLGSFVHSLFPTASALHHSRWPGNGFLSKEHLILLTLFHQRARNLTLNALKQC